jgi:hypothetical protein
VLDDLRKVIGKSEEKFDPDARDPGQAKRLHALTLAVVEELMVESAAGSATSVVRRHRA